MAPKEATLNLPERSYSHALQQRVAKEAAKGSFDEAILAVRQQTGVLVPKRQAEEIVVNAARDFDAFYNEREKAELRRINKASEILVLTTDGKGVTMLKDSLREATRKRAEQTEHKLETRLSKGEKANAKRMAQVASVYSIDRHERSAEDILERRQTEAPKPEGKRVWASLVHDQKSVIGDMLDEAQRRDPRQCRPWAVLVDGQTHQLALVTAALTERELDATIVLDLVHVIEYLWKASRDFHGEGSPAGEAWVGHYLAMVLAGKAALAAAGMRRSATRQNPKRTTRRRHLRRLPPRKRRVHALRRVPRAGPADRDRRNRRRVPLSCQRSDGHHRRALEFERRRGGAAIAVASRERGLG